MIKNIVKRETSIVSPETLIQKGMALKFTRLSLHRTAKRFKAQFAPDGTFPGKQRHSNFFTACKGHLILDGF